MCGVSVCGVSVFVSLCGVSVCVCMTVSVCECVWCECVWCECVCVRERERLLHRLLISASERLKLCFVNKDHEGHRISLLKGNSLGTAEDALTRLKEWFEHNAIHHVISVF